jgi:RNA polymerase sigma factor (sigma-70 family)
MMARLLQHINRLTDQETDSALLARFVRQGDRGAFATLVARHGPVVYNVCRRQLGDAHAAEDAFQAVFLVLARRADGLRFDSLAAWLHGVAVRISRNARRAFRRCPVRGEPVTADEALDARPDPLAQLSAREVLRAVEDEVRRLPRAYRLAVVLCCLEGLSQEEAARRLGWSVGSVKGRLERGRARLRELLTRRGLAPVTVMAVLLAARKELSADLTARTVTISLSSGRGVPVPGDVLRLAEHVLKGATVFKKLAVAAVLVLGVTAAGAFGPRDDKEELRKDPPTAVSVELNDGSRVVGTAAAPRELPLKTSFGEVRIPVAQVGSVQFKDDRGTVAVRFHNGDQLTGTLDLKAIGDLKVLTALGETTVPLKLVTLWKLEQGPARAQVTARASNTDGISDPSGPFLDKPVHWCSGGYAPGWIEADLGTVRKLDRIALVVRQTPKGDTVHEVWVSNEPIGTDTAKAKLVHTFRGETDNIQELKHTFAPGLTARYVQIRTTESPSWIAWNSIDLQVR